jgi:hypothetical protein
MPARINKTLRERYYDLLRLRTEVQIAEMGLKAQEIADSMSVYEKRTPQSNRRDEGTND